MYTHTSTQGQCSLLASLRLVTKPERVFHCRVAWIFCQMQGKGCIHQHSAPTLLKGSPRGLCHRSDPHLLGPRPREPHPQALQLCEAYMEDPRLLAHRLVPGVPLLLDPLLVPGASLCQAPLMVPGATLLLTRLLELGASILLTALLVFGASPLLPPTMAQLLMQPCTATWLLV